MKNDFTQQHKNLITVNFFVHFCHILTCYFSCCDKQPTIPAFLLPINPRNPSIGEADL